MKNGHALLLLTLGLLAACSSTPTRREFTVISYPPGATIYLDTEKVGVTDREKVAVDFERRANVLIRVEKDGYQPVGTRVDAFSPQLVPFVLQPSSDNENSKILGTLKDIARKLQEISDKLTRT